MSFDIRGGINIGFCLFRFEHEAQNLTWQQVFKFLISLAIIHGSYFFFTCNMWGTNERPRSIFFSPPRIFKKCALLCPVAVAVALGGKKTKKRIRCPFGCTRGPTKKIQRKKRTVFILFSLCPFSNAYGTYGGASAFFVGVEMSGISVF